MINCIGKVASLGTIKRGDTFAFTVQIETEDGEPYSGIADKLRCHGRYAWNRDLVTELIITESEELGTYYFTAEETETWKPNETIKFDIEYNDGINVASSDTFEITVEADITYGQIEDND